MWIATVMAGAANLQATLAASSATATPFPGVHHPIACPAGDLAYHPDGALTCPHATAPPGDSRTQVCIDHSIAILILEQLSRP